MDTEFQKIFPNFFTVAANQIELAMYLRRHGEEKWIARRANAVLLSDKGKYCVKISKILHLDAYTIRGCRMTMAFTSQMPYPTQLITANT